MKPQFMILMVMLFAAVTTVASLTSSAPQINVARGEEYDSQISPHNALPSPSDTATQTIYLPILAKPRPPLFVGMTAHWESAGYGRGSEVWDAGYHLTRNLDTMTDADTIRSNNYGSYSPNPNGLPDESWYSYYSITTLAFKASSAPPDPDWKWAGADWILPYSISLSNGATVMIYGQGFLVSGPYAGYTAFGQAVQYWQLTNRDKFLLWANGGDWTLYAHPGEIILRYDAGSTRLLIYMNELRRGYYRGNLTSDTIQWIDNLTSTNAWHTVQGTLQGVSSYASLSRVDTGQSDCCKSKEDGGGEVFLSPKYNQAGRHR